MDPPLFPDTCRKQVLTFPEMVWPALTPDAAQSVSRCLLR